MPSTASDPGAVHGLRIPHEDCERTLAPVRTLVSYRPSKKSSLNRSSTMKYWPSTLTSWKQESVRARGTPTGDTFLVYSIGRDEGMGERRDAALAHFGNRAATELTRLIQWAHAPPTRGPVGTWYAHMCHLIDRYRSRKDEAGRFAHHLDVEMGHFKRNCWVEQILPLRETCRLKGLATYQIPVEAATCWFQGKAPDVSWI